MIKAVLFDLDGTLLNRDKSIQRFVGNQYERLKQHLGHISQDTYISRFVELDCRGYVWKDKVYAQLVKEVGIHGITAEDLLEDYLTYFKRSCVPFPNLIEMLEVLKSRDILLGMITNGRGTFQMDTIQALGIERYFREILISEREGVKKPDPIIFERALRKLDVLASEAIFVGDHPENDIKAAQFVGMIGVWKKDHQWLNVEADFELEDLLELPSIIEGIHLNS